MMMAEIFWAVATMMAEIYRAVATMLADLFLDEELDLAFKASLARAASSAALAAVAWPAVTVFCCSSFCSG